jgi:hypothetical protein
MMNLFRYCLLDDSLLKQLLYCIQYWVNRKSGKNWIMCWVLSNYTTYCVDCCVLAKSINMCVCNSSPIFFLPIGIFLWIGNFYFKFGKNGLFRNGAVLRYKLYNTYNCIYMYYYYFIFGYIAIACSATRNRA